MLKIDGLEHILLPLLELPDIQLKIQSASVCVGTGSDFPRLFAQCPYLASIKLSTKDTNQLSVFCALFQHWNRLQAVHVLADSTSNCFAKLAPLLAQCNNLRLLRLPPIEDAALQPLIQTMPQLEELEITHVFKGAIISAAFVAEIAQWCVNFRVLRTPSVRITDADLVTLCEGCPQLATLIVHDSSPLSIAALTVLETRALHMTELNVPFSLFDDSSPSTATAAAGAGNVTQSGHASLYPHHTMPATTQALPRLERIRVSSSAWEQSPVAAARFVKLARRARHVSFAFLPVFSPCVCRTLAQAEGMDLLSLDLGCAFKLTDNIVIPLVCRYRNLRALSVHSGPFSDAFLHNVAIHCPSLKEIRLRDLPGPTDRGVVEVLTLCPALKVVSLFGCINLTDAVLTALVHHCPAIIELDCTRCSNMSADGFLRTVEGLPRLKTLALSRTGFDEQQVTRLKALRKTRRIALSMAYY